MKFVIYYEQYNNLQRFELSYEEIYFENLKIEVSCYFQIDPFEMVFYYFDRENRPVLMLNQQDFDQFQKQQFQQNFELFLTSKIQVFIIQDCFEERTFYKVFLEDCKCLKIERDSQDQIKLDQLINNIKKYLQDYDFPDDTIKILISNLKKIYLQWLLDGTDFSEICSKYFSDSVTDDFTATITEQSSKNSQIKEQTNQENKIFNNSMFHPKTQHQNQILNFTQYSIHKSQIEKSEKKIDDENVNSQIDISNIDSFLMDDLLNNKVLLDKDQSDLDTQLQEDSMSEYEPIPVRQTFKKNKKPEEETIQKAENLFENSQKSLQKKSTNPTKIDPSMIKQAKNKIKRSKKKDKDREVNKKYKPTKKKNQDQSKQQTNTQEQIQMLVQKISLKKQNSIKSSYQQKKEKSIKNNQDKQKINQLNTKTDDKSVLKKPMDRIKNQKRLKSDQFWESNTAFKFAYDKEIKQFKKTQNSYEGL